MIFTGILILCSISYCLAEVWTVYVHTGNERFAGTDSSVFIRLFNSQGESTSEYQLTHFNWIPENNDFPLRNLFEIGAHEQFRIRTEDIGPVSKIQIRHNNFPAFQSDWLLDQVIVQSNRNDAKYTFQCNCWLRHRRPFITIYALADPRAIDKNTTNNAFSKTNRTLVIILIVLITLLISLFCCHKEYRRHQRDPSLSLNETIEQSHREPALLDEYYPQSPRLPSPSSGPQLWINTIRRWKNSRQEPPSYSNTQAGQTVTAPSATITPTEEPPAYDDLYPNSVAPINTSSNSNS